MRREINGELLWVVDDCGCRATVTHDYVVELCDMHDRWSQYASRRKELIQAATTEQETYNQRALGRQIMKETWSDHEE